MSCLTLRTGRSDCYARFYPSRFQLDLFKDGSEERIDLGFSGSRLLERLLQAPGEVVPREELLNHAWSDRIVGQGSLNQQIYTLRQVLADEKQRQIIQTLPRRGYMFNPRFLLGPDESPCDTEGTLGTGSNPAPVETEAIPPAAPTHRPLRSQPLPLLLSLCALFCLSLAALATFYFTQLKANLFTTEVRLGNVDILYVDESEELLQDLMRETDFLANHLQGIAEKPVNLLVYMTSGFYEIVCLQPDGGANWLMVHEDQLGKIPDAQLRKCLQ